MSAVTARVRRGAAAATAIAALTVLAACSGGSAGNAGGAADSGAPVTVNSDSASTSPFEGSALDSPIAKPTGVLTDTSGQPYDLATATQGKLVLLYFGYTHCPDVCPTTMADIGVALSQVPAQVRNNTTVVMITSDPERDTPAVLRTWLDAFDTRFIGLTGPVDGVLSMADAVGVSIEPPVTNPDGTIAVTHGAQVLAFSPTDDLAHVVWTAGTGSAAYVHDLPLLAAGTT